MDRSNIDKIAQNAEERLLLAKIWDRIQTGIRKNIPTATGFLSLHQQEMCRYLFGNTEGVVSFGGHPDAERKMFFYLPDYLEESYLYSPDSPIACVRATYYKEDTLTHRDFLGALMGAGITRESVGDICIGHGSCDFLITHELAEYICQNVLFAGRTKLHLEQIPLANMAIPKPQVQQIRDTLASIRLDSIISSGFRISRTAAAQHICSGRASVDGIPCEKPDKSIAQGSKISVRGLGKICLQAINGQTKKGRVSVIIDRYV